MSLHKHVRAIRGSHRSRHRGRGQTILRGRRLDQPAKRLLLPQLVLQRLCDLVSGRAHELDLQILEGRSARLLLRLELLWRLFAVLLGDVKRLTSARG